jgi:hypothetical protein
MTTVIPILFKVLGLSVRALLALGVGKGLGAAIGGAAPAVVWAWGLFGIETLDGLVRNGVLAAAALSAAVVVARRRGRAGRAG